MLNLTRYPGERIIVTHEASGDKLTIEVAEVNPANNQVRLALTAPRTFLIDREEIHEDKNKHARTLGDKFRKFHERGRKL